MNSSPINNSIYCRVRRVIVYFLKINAETFVIYYNIIAATVDNNKISLDVVEVILSEMT